MESSRSSRACKMVLAVAVFQIIRFPAEGECGGGQEGEEDSPEAASTVKARMVVRIVKAGVADD